MVEGRFGELVPSFRRQARTLSELSSVSLLDPQISENLTRSTNVQISTSNRAFELNPQIPDFFHGSSSPSPRSCLLLLFRLISSVRSKLQEYLQEFGKVLFPVRLRFLGDSNEREREKAAQRPTRDASCSTFQCNSLPDFS